MADLDKYCETFGETRGLAYFRSSTPFAEATALFSAELVKENKALKEKLALSEQSEALPLSGSSADNQRSAKKGFASKLNVPGQ